MQKNYDELLTDFQAELEALPVAGLKPAESLPLTLPVIRRHLSVLKDRVLDQGFEDAAEEIHFFKWIKPRFYAEKIYALEFYGIEMNRPVGTQDMIRAFLEDELRQVHRFFQQQAFLYQYYRSGAAELDSLYFMRGAEVSAMVAAEMPDPDPKFSTAMDYLFAKFIAYERLQNYLVGAMLAPIPLLHEMPLHRKSRRELRWTGDAINAVELGFSLHDTGQLNDGKASITEIFEWMEVNLHVSVGKPHKRLDEIDARKRISKTQFLDDCRSRFLNRLDRRNEYDPEKEELRRQRAERKRKAAEKRAAEQAGSNS